MSKIIRSIFVVLAVVFLFVVSLSSAANSNQKSGPGLNEIHKKLNQEVPGGVVVSNDSITKVIADINKVPLQDNPDVYQYDDPGSVVTMYVTVRRGNDLENTNHTWSEINSSTKFFFEKMEHVLVPKAEVILQIGDENGPLPGQLGYDALVTNALQIREVPHPFNLKSLIRLSFLLIPENGADKERSPSTNTLSIQLEFGINFLLT
jgi:hypothetical protein